MQIREFSQPVTSKKLNESLASKFGLKISLEQFSDVQLEDARNKLRTKISQFEVTESFDSINESPEYQKTRMFLDVINQEIMERDEGKCETCHEDPCECDDEEEKMDEEAITSEAVTQYLSQVISERAQARRIPTAWINSAVRRLTLGESDTHELKDELVVRYDLTESVASYILAEGEEDKAEIIMATKDMVDRITGWLEDVAAMKAEQLLELTDSIGKALGSDVAMQYQEQVKPALEAIYAALETSRQGLTGALATVSGEGAPTMGAPVGGADLGAPADVGAPAMGGEEGGLPSTEVPPAGVSGREKRESVDYSRKLSLLLNSKKK
jgi:hypothetical protein